MHAAQKMWPQGVALGTECGMRQMGQQSSLPMKHSNEDTSSHSICFSASEMYSLNGQDSFKTRR